MNIKKTELRSLLKGFDLPPEKESDITKLEDALGVKFPEAFKDILSLGEELHMGPREGRNSKDLHFDFHATTTPHYEYVSETIDEAYERLQDINGKWNDIIPFGAVGNGDQVCFDYRYSESPLIVLFNHERLTDEDPFLIEAESMEELISRASPPS